MLSPNFIACFSNLEDPRIENHNTKHKFMDILTLAFIANLCGCDNWVEVEIFCKSKIEFFKKILELPNGIPSHDTFGRVFSIIDIDQFEELFSKWMQSIFHKTKGEIVAIDGKTIRAARNKGNLKGLHIVNAWACENRISLGAMHVDKKENEIIAITKILDFLNITNCTVTIDAIGCQKNIANKIIKKGGNYVLCVKNNQKELKSEIVTTFNILEEKSSKKIDTTNDFNKGHGREEYRNYHCLPIEQAPEIQQKWPSVKAIIKVVRKRIIDSVVEEQTNYFISSHAYLSNQIPKAIRKHWNIENCLHWQLDVSFNEDKCRARKDNEAANISLLRKMSLSYLKKDKKTKAGIVAKRKKASWDDNYLLDILSEIGAG